MQEDCFNSELLPHMYTAVLLCWQSHSWLILLLFMRVIFQYNKPARLPTLCLPHTSVQRPWQHGQIYPSNWLTRESFTLTSKIVIHFIDIYLLTTITFKTNMYISLKKINIYREKFYHLTMFSFCSMTCVVLYVRSINTDSLHPIRFPWKWKYGGNVHFYHSQDFRVCW